MSKFKSDEQIEKLALEYAKGKGGGDEINGKAYIMSFTINPYPENSSEWVKRNEELQKYWKEEREFHKKMAEESMKSVAKDCLEAIRKQTKT
jgi:hypothetical protein